MDEQSARSLYEQRRDEARRARSRQRDNVTNTLHATKTTLQNIIDNLESGKFEVRILDDGEPRTVSNVTVESLKNTIKNIDKALESAYTL